MPEIPTLDDLKTRECSVAELQAALLHLILLHNHMHDDINKMIADGRIRSSKESLMNKTFGL